MKQESSGLLFDPTNYIFQRNNFNIKTVKTSPDPLLSKTDATKHIKQVMREFAKLQEKLYAQRKFGVIIVLQAMDAAGKDSLVNHVFKDITPAGFQVASFKQPSKEELAHDFLWRINAKLPERGKIGIFNRSYYEDVLISRVHPQILVNAGLPGIDQLSDINESLYEQRYNDIRNYEQYLSHNGYLILKFFLHVSKKEQRARFISRIEEPHKNWKFSSADIRERAYWNQYQDAYQRAINATATIENPWYVLPADDKWTCRAIFADIIMSRLSQLPLAYPKVSATEENALEKAYRELKKEH